MTEHHGPPKKDGGRAPSPTATNRSPKPTSTDPIPADQHEQFDALADNQRRRETALRTDGGEDPDPLHPGRQYHRPPTGFRAAGYREGYVAGLRWACRELWPLLTTEGRVRAVELVAATDREAQQ
jgi:hypothetical protein